MKQRSKPYTGPFHTDDTEYHYSKEADFSGRLYFDKQAFDSVHFAMKNGDKESASKAREELVEGCQRMVRQVAGMYSGPGFPLMDLVQEGNMGLLRGLEKYEPERGLMPSTYLTSWIRFKIFSYITDNRGAYRIGPILQKRIRRYLGMLEDMQRIPENAEEIQREIDATFSLYELELMRNNAGHPYYLSLDASFPESDASLIDFVPSVDSLPEDEAAKEQMAGLCDNILSSLDTWERVYFEENVFNKLRPREIAEKYLDSGEAVRQKIEKAKRKLRKNPDAIKLSHILQ